MKMKLHAWWCEPTPGLVTWRCERCNGKVVMTAVSLSDPERVRSLVVALSETCPSTHH